ncbi:MAG: arsenic transporter [Alphaproteobacteria bacterium]|nr:arsenic transporter [Alphaproteobacteria bacterium]
MPASAAWIIAGISTAGVILRPFRVPEAIWAVAGAAMLVLLGLLSWQDAWRGVLKGLDVYLFLAGMMLIAELARQEGLFDWLAALAVARAGGSPQRLFLLVYAVGTLVTVFLSNDATAVVLTPAVYAAARAAGATPLPYLLVCAFIANAASFVLPISNPANLVVFGDRMPALAVWLQLFALPSLVAILVTFAALYLTQRRALGAETISSKPSRPQLARGGRLAAYGIVAIAFALVGCSALNLDLGLPTFVCGALTTALVLALNRLHPWRLLREISWSVLPLVAGLFVLVEAMVHTGVIAQLSQWVATWAAQSPAAATWGSGVLVALATNLMNNLPVGLIAGSVVAGDHLPDPIVAATLIGVDLGPNLSVTGSLATILWLVALRREGIEVGTRQFLCLGFLVMPPALLLAIAALRLTL